MAIRPIPYSQEEREAAITRVVESLSSGIPLAEVCRQEGMPSDHTIRNWMDEDQVTASAIARAREAGFDQIALDALKIADHSDGDFVEDKDGNERPNHEMVNRSRLRVETRLKLLAKWDPKRYGDQLNLNHSGAIQNTTSEHLNARLTHLLGKAGIVLDSGGVGSADEADGA